jgi:hypothetical protein
MSDDTELSDLHDVF